MAQAVAEQGKRGRPVGIPSVASTFIGLQEVDAMPEKRTPVRNTDLDAAFKQIQNDGLVGRAYEIQVYQDEDHQRALNSARNKASSLRKRYKTEDNWTVTAGDSKNVPGAVGLFVRYG